MVLCNFDEFWIYDLNIQLNDPVHILKTKDLLDDWHALAFLHESYIDPRFDNNNVEVTERVAKIVGSLFLSLEERGLDPIKAQRFVLQLVVALFAEDVDLIPEDTLSNILKAAVKEPIMQKELGDLFTAMATKDESRKPDQYKDIKYFNGGIFNEVHPVELHYNEFDLLVEAAKQNWAKVRPSIFGSVFEGSMDPYRRHEQGAHFTSEHDIHKIVGPTIVRPFKERIHKAKTKTKLKDILQEISEFKVLDPACGSGNFLYIAFRELRRLETEVLELLGEDLDQIRISHISPNNFYGIDTNKFAIELAKVSLSIGRKLSADELGIIDPILPFQDLEENFSDKDALLEAQWPKVNAIIGTPPFQSKNKIQQEMGAAYIKKVRDKYPEVPGMADYCVYWFRKAHDLLEQNQRAGLVGTNTIRQNYSREGGLDYIVANEGVIKEAVSTQPWSGEATVYVSIVNWLKGTENSKKRLYHQPGDSLDSPIELENTPLINSDLTSGIDVTIAKKITAYAKSNTTLQGQTHGHEAFLLSKDDGSELINEDSTYKDVLFPFMNANDMIGTKDCQPKRFVIDFSSKSLTECQKYPKLFKQIKENVLPKREKEAKKEQERNEEILKDNPKAKVNKHHKNFLNKWWVLSYAREKLVSKISHKKRYIVCGRVTKRPIFQFLSSDIHPSDAMQAFIFDDDYSFGVLQSDIHWQWFVARCSTLKGDFRYTSNTVFDSFPWPQNPSEEQVVAVSSAAKKLREVRNKELSDNNLSLRELYRLLELPGDSPLKNAHIALDQAVLESYGFKKNVDILKSLLDLNLELSIKETNKEDIVSPGIPSCVKAPESLITEDCIEFKWT